MMKNIPLRKLTMPVAIGIGMLLTGCGSTGNNETTATVTDTTSSTTSSDSSRQLTQQQARITELERELNTARTSARTANAANSTQSSDDELFPPNPQPGQCYARILLPAQYSDSTERVLVREESERVEIIPAVFGTSRQRVLVKEASIRLEIVPATYETVTERVLVRAASTRIERIPATYRTVTDRVMISPARTEWKRGPAINFASAGNNVLDSVTTDTGEIMCLVEVPAVYETVTRQEVQTPAQTSEITVPAEYQTVTKEVLASPASTREVVVPAVYDTVDVATETSPARENRVVIPAEYNTVSIREKITDEQLEWRRVVCDVNLTRANISTLQRSLDDKGHYSGPIDGLLGPQTLAAANAFARSTGLATGNNYIAYEVIEELDLSF